MTEIQKAEPEPAWDQDQLREALMKRLAKAIGIEMRA